MQHQWQPKGWLAVLLGLTIQPFVFLYLNRQQLFWLYFVPAIALSILDLKLHTSANENEWYANIYFSWVFLILCPIHGFIITRQYDVSQPRSWFARWWAAILCYLVPITLLILIRAFYYEPFSVPSRSMSPTLNPGNQLIVSKFGFGNYRYLGMQLLKSAPTIKPQRGDVIVFQYPPKPQTEFVKRVIGLPGDTIIYRDKTIYLKKTCATLAADCAQYSAIKQAQTAPTNAKYDGLIWVEESIDNQKYNVLLNPTRIDSNHQYFRQAARRSGEWLIPDDHYFVLGDNRDNSLDSRYWGFVPQQNIIGKVVYVW